MSIWSKILKISGAIKTKALFKINYITSSKKSAFRWAFGLNLFFFFVILAYRSDDWNYIITKQTQVLSEIEIPEALRNYVYNYYSKKYGVNTEQTQLPLNAYPTFSSFFTRKIARTIINELPSTISSPCDGSILSFSQIQGDSCSIIKGNSYSLSELLLGVQENQINQSIVETLKRSKGSKLYQVIIYLAPGDYHRFHSPTRMKIMKRKDIGGQYNSVNEAAILSGKKIYQKNARVCLFSEWEQGTLAMVMVGALNVSRISITDKNQFVRGQELGYFNLGSTIVMILQAKALKQWKIKEGQPIKYGQPILQYE